MTRLEEWAKENPFAAKMAGADVAIQQHASMKAKLDRLTPEAAPLTPELKGNVDEADAKVRKLLT